MRMNTIAVLYNDAWEQLAREYPGLAAAMRAFNQPTQGWENDGQFHTGRIVSMGDSEVSQVVVVKDNDGERVTETSASEEALECLARLLTCHGYDVSRRPAAVRRAKERSAGKGQTGSASRGEPSRRHLHH